MDVKNPKYHEGTFGTPDGELQRVGWVIDVPTGRESLFYSIALAALLKSAENESKFETWFEAIFGNVKNVDSKQLQEVKCLIKSFNPFLNKYACYRDRVLKILVKDFICRLHDYILKNGSEMYSEGIPVSSIDNFMLNSTADGGEAVIRAACNMLRCKIFLLSSDEVLYFGALKKEFLHFNEKNFDELILYRESSFSDENQSFHFGIDANTGLQLQKRALSVILQRAGISLKIIEEILPQCDMQNDLLLLFLQNKNLCEIKVLYRQSYIIFQLSEAGYRTDPMGEDSDGKTGFFYAMEKGDTETIRVLYDYISGSFKWDDCSTRNSNKFVLDNLENLESVLKKCIKMFQEQSKLKHEEKLDKITFVQELIQINCFQKDVCKKIVMKRQEYSDAREDIAQTDERKHLIVSILSTYKEYSNIGQVDWEGDESNEAVLHKMYKKYMENWRFYNLLDQTTALLVFDNILLLKKLTLDNGEFEKAYSYFMNFIFCSSCYNETRLSVECVSKMKKSKTRDSLPPGSEKLWCTITFLERLMLGECLKVFKNLFLETDGGDNTIDSLIKCEIKTLRSLLEITDGFVLKRMMHYIGLATEVDLEEDRKMGMLVIERALQVICESIKIADLKDYFTDILESLLASSFPLGKEKNIKKIKNLFTPWDRRKMFSRLEAEKMLDLFKDVQEELKIIKVKFSNVLDAQILRVHKDIIKKCSKHFCKGVSILETFNKVDRAECRKMKSCSVLLENQNASEMLESYDQVQSVQDNTLINCTTVRQEGKKNKKQRRDLEKLKNVFKDVEKGLELCLTELTSEKLVSEYRLNIDLHFNHLFQYLQRSETAVFSRQDIILVNHHFICIRVVLQTVVEDSVHCSSKRKLLDRIQKLNLFINTKYYNEQSIKDFKTKLTTIADEVNVFYKDVIRIIKMPKGTDTVNCVHFPGITKLEEVISDHSYNLTEYNKRIILQCASKESKEIHKAKKTLIESLKSRKFLTSDIAVQMIKKLPLPVSKQNELEKNYRNRKMVESNLSELETVKDYFGSLKNYFERNNEMTQNYCEILCKFLKLGESEKKLLKKVAKDPWLEKKRCLLFLLNRITQLKEIMLKPYFESSWIESKGKNAAEEVKRQVLWHYLHEPKLQAAVEMLLFDCINLLKKRTDFEKFRPKFLEQLTVANFRQFLGASNPFSETLSQILDPSDLTSELVSIALELITDLELVETLYERCLFNERSNSQMFVNQTYDGSRSQMSTQTFSYSTEEKKMKNYLEWLDVQ